MLHSATKPKLSERIATRKANSKRNARIRARADEIVSKHTPDHSGSSNPLNDPAGFIARCEYRARRNRLLRMAETELRCLDYALEHWQHDYDAALAELSPERMAEHDAANRARCDAARAAMDDRAATYRAQKIAFDERHAAVRRAA